MQIGTIIQARSGSTRLPNKILLPLPYGNGKTALEHVIERLKKSKLSGHLIVATTENPKDDPICEIAKKLGVDIFRGSEENVLDRYYKAAKYYNIDIVIRITSDCPCVDWSILDEMINFFVKKVGELDYLSNTIVRTFPHGADIEIFTINSLEKAVRNAKNDFEFEHVTPYIYLNKDMFKIANFYAPDDLFKPDLRITLDTEQDYILLCSIFDHFFSKGIEDFKIKDIIKLVNEKPWLMMINATVHQKKLKYENISEELKDAIKILRLNYINNISSYLEKEQEKIIAQFT